MILNPLPNWVTSDETQYLLSALSKGGVDQDKFRFVGGCVRDHLLGGESQDIDLATPLLPDEVLKRLAEAGIKTVPSGLKYGSLQAYIGKKKYELTTLRRDVTTDGRHAEVSFTDDWTIDAQRRDFTLNALYLSPTGSLFDPCGQGLEDLKHHRIRFIGQADQRIQEDYLRLLRFFRFYAHYGQGEMDSQALQACQRYAPHLKQLAAERLHTELFKLLKAPNPLPSVTKMIETNVWSSLTQLSLKPNLSYFSNLIQSEPFWSLPTDSLRRLVALCNGHEQSINALAKTLKFSNTEYREAQRLCQGLTWAEVSSEKLWYQEGWSRAQGLLLLRHLKGLKADPLDSSYQNRSRPLFPLSGHDLIRLGIAPGANLGHILAEVESWWIEQNFAPSYKDCFIMAKQKTKQLNIL